MAPQLRLKGSEITAMRETGHDTTGKEKVAMIGLEERIEGGACGCPIEPPADSVSTNTSSLS